MSTDEPRLERWEKLTRWPLIALAVVFLVAYAVPILWPDNRLLNLCYDAVLITWLIFAADYVIRLGLARNKVRFVKRHWLDLIAVMLPLVRQLQVVRIIATLSVLHRSSSPLRSRVALYAPAASGLLIFVTALAVLDAERKHPEANITTFRDALWWGIETVTTVGYGDRFPVSTPGRIVATVLMLSGIALLGVVTASVASWFIERDAESSGPATCADVEALTEQVVALRAEITALRGELVGVGPAAATGPGLSAPDRPRRGRRAS